MIDPLSELTHILLDMSQEPMLRGLMISPNQETSISKMLKCIEQIRMMTSEYRKMIWKYENRMIDLVDDNNYLRNRVAELLRKERRNECS